MALAPALINAVNPRLIHYGSLAWKLALLILVLNYGLVAVLGLMFTTMSCTTAVDGPTSSMVPIMEDVKSQRNEFLALMSPNGNVVATGTTTVTTNVSACVYSARELTATPSTWPGEPGERIIDGPGCWPIIDCIGAS